jgi:hypothetical protein
LIIISACHSSRLAQVFIDAKVPAVVSITASATVMEEAAKEFNIEFLVSLIAG